MHVKCIGILKPHEFIVRTLKSLKKTVKYTTTIDFCYNSENSSINDRILLL